MAHDLGQVLWVHCVQDIEEVFSWWSLADRVFVRKVGHHFNVLRELWIEVLHRQFVVVGHLDSDHVRLLQELLVTGEHCLQEVFVDDRLVRQVVLEAVKKRYW